MLWGRFDGAEILCATSFETRRWRNSGARSSGTKKSAACNRTIQDLADVFIDDRTRLSDTLQKRREDAWNMLH